MPKIKTKFGSAARYEKATLWAGKSMKATSFDRALYWFGQTNTRGWSRWKGHCFRQNPMSNLRKPEDPFPPEKRQANEAAARIWNTVINTPDGQQAFKDMARVTKKNLGMFNNFRRMVAFACSDDPSWTPGYWILHHTIKQKGPNGIACWWYRISLDGFWRSGHGPDWFNIQNYRQKFFQFSKWFYYDGYASTFVPIDNVREDTYVVMKRQSNPVSGVYFVEWKDHIYHPKPPLPPH